MFKTKIVVNGKFLLPKIILLTTPVLFPAYVFFFSHSDYLLVNASQESQLSPRLPISFVGNGGFTTLNGVTNPMANGTEDDPFVIEGWNISGFQDYGVYIADTDAHFVIRNVLVENGEQGICLFQVTNARLENVTVNNCIDGIQLLHASEITATSSRFSNNSEHGIYMADSRDNTIRNVLIEDGDQGVHLFHVTNAQIEDVGVNNCVVGVQLFYTSNSTVTYGEFSNNSEHGVYVLESNNNMISHNKIVNNFNGIELGMQSSNTIYDNLFDNFDSNAVDYGTSNWNITLEVGRNMIGGMYRGGNYFHDYAGEDLDEDGIGDIPHKIEGKITETNEDKLPLFNLPPKARFIYAPNNITIADTVEFFDSSSDLENRIASWQWSFGDEINSTLTNPTHQYAKPGDYIVSLTVTDYLGKSDTWQSIVKVRVPVLFVLHIAKINIQPQIKQMQVRFLVSWAAEPDTTVWITRRLKEENKSFLLLENTDTLIPIDINGQFPRDSCRADFFLSTMTNYTIQFDTSLSDSLQEEYEINLVNYELVNESPSSSLDSPHFSHYLVEIELVRPQWFIHRWDLLTLVPIVIIAILIIVPNLLIPPKDSLREHLTIYVSVVFFSLGFISSILQFLPPVLLLVEILLPIEIIIATLLLVGNIYANRKEVKLPICIFASRLLREKISGLKRSNS